MSFKIFSLQLTGKIKPVSTIENQRKALETDYQEFLRVESSDKLKAFLELEKYVNSEEFKRKKNEIESLSFKGSKEENQLKEFKALKKASGIRKYFKVQGSTDLSKFEKEKDSQRMKDYYVLLEFIKEGQFEKEKKEIKSQVFKGSVEEKHLLEFKRLDKSAGIKAFKELNGSQKLKQHKALEESGKFKRYLELKNASSSDKEKQAEFKKLRKDPDLKAYFKFEKSKKLRLYHEITGSHDLIRHEELKDYLAKDEYKKREAFLKDKKKFEKSETFRKQTEFKNLAADSIVKFVLKFEKSALYKNYLDVKDSFDLKRYYELEGIIQSEEYKAQKAWLEDKKRWEQTEEFARFKAYQKEKELPENVLYAKYKDSDAFNFIKNWEVSFADDFDGNNLDTEKWSTSSVVAEKTLGSNYAMPGDLNLFTNGENINTGNNLRIQVKKEQVNGMTWKMPAGFVPTEFEYSSGILNNAKAFSLLDGVVEAKIKFDPVKQVLSTFCLSTEDPSARANMLEMGTRNNLGFSELNASGKVQSSGLDISNLKKGSYIFTLEKSGSEFIWKINETEVFRQNNNGFNKPLYIGISSMVIHEVPGTLLPVNFDIEWIKCYTKK